MKLQQLRYLAAVVQNGLNVTTAAQALHTSQPGVSKQIRLLEEELGLTLFVRDGRALKRLTPAGEEVAARALRMLREAQALKSLAKDLKQSDRGSLSIGTTHTQARYVLPRVIRDFRQKYPGRAAAPAPGHLGPDRRDGDARSHRLRHQHRQPGQVPGLRAAAYLFVAPADHRAEGSSAGADRRSPRCSSSPNIRWSPTCSASPARRRCSSSSRAPGLEPNVSLTARDADVIKTYVRLGLGVGVVASMAIEPEDEKDLAVVEAGHLFPSHVTWIGFRAGALLRGFTYDFIQLLAPHLTRERIERILSAPTPAAREKLISAIEAAALRLKWGHSPFTSKRGRT